jgi:hypothetical protein
MASEAAELFQRMQVAEQNNLRNSLGLQSHEKECAIRYGHINQTMRAIKRDMRLGILALIGTLASVAGLLIKLVFFPHI